MNARSFIKEVSHIMLFKNHDNTLIKVKLLFLVISLSLFTYTFIFITQLKIHEFKDLQEEALKYSAEDARYAEIYRKKEKLSSQLKYVLLWTRTNLYPFELFGNTQKVFIQRKCPVVDCYITSDRNFFGGDLKRFDAIAFNGRILNYTDLPRERYDHQKYIYVNTESASNEPVCNIVFDNFFNWTYTYRLDSDILMLYIEIRNNKNKVVGPKPDMKWMDPALNEDLLKNVKIRWHQKKNAVAWMASNCYTSNNREKLVRKLQVRLNQVNILLAPFGGCGFLSCPREIDSSCWKLMERHYYFYLSFENSNCEDYVTEKLLNPLQHFVIPIVYGGANYSRFLPPGSYLDASKLSPGELVERMSNIMTSFNKYVHFFKWRSAYKYTNPERNNICALCSALHNRTMMDNKKSYKQFREWWLPDYRQNC